MNDILTLHFVTLKPSYINYFELGFLPYCCTSQFLLFRQRNNCHLRQQFFHYTIWFLPRGHKIFMDVPHLPSYLFSNQLIWEGWIRGKLLRRLESTYIDSLRRGRDITKYNSCTELLPTILNKKLFDELLQSFKCAYRPSFLSFI